MTLTWPIPDAPPCADVREIVRKAKDEEGFEIAARHSALTARGCLLLAVGAAVAGVALQPPREIDREELAWVFFTDKGDVQSSHLSPGALDRRRAARGASNLVDERDAPLRADYVTAVEAVGATVRTSSRWLNAVSVRADRETRAALIDLPFVRAMSPVRRLATASLEPSVPGPDEKGFYGRSAEQLERIGVPRLHRAGFTGKGMVIGVLDTGFRRKHRAFRNDEHQIDVLDEWDFLDNDASTAPQPGDRAEQHHHGTYILGMIASRLPGRLVGSAYDASYLLAKVEDADREYHGEEDLFVAGLEWLEAQGAQIVTSSVVIYDRYSQEQLDGRTSPMSIALGTAAENGMLCFEGVGNRGHDDDPTTSHLVPPADAFGVLSVGGVDRRGRLAGFSSDGPTADGRVKPEILAPGNRVETVHPDSNTRLVATSGTSLATPLAAGAAALVWQAHPDWTAEQVRRALIETADVYLRTGTHDPDFVRGYGLMNAWEASQWQPPRDRVAGRRPQHPREGVME